MKRKPAAENNQASSGMLIERAADVQSDELYERHPEFFFDNTLVAILVGKTMFNVHKYQLAKSEVFSDGFKKSKPEGDEPEEGSSPEHPIRLRGVPASDFAALLRVLYASHFSSNQPAPEASLVIPAFRLANMFKFEELRAYLLPLAEKNLDDVDKVVFAREFDIKDWLAPAHTRLCRREKPLNSEEADKLGVQSVLIIWRMREQHRGRPRALSSSSGNQDYCSNCISATYTGYGGNCYKCHGFYSNLMRYRGASSSNDPASADSTGNAAIDVGVRKWVEDGCIVND